jgi:hypothetical protein
VFSGEIGEGVTLVFVSTPRGPLDIKVYGEAW